MDRRKMIAYGLGISASVGLFSGEAVAGLFSPRFCGTQDSYMFFTEKKGPFRQDKWGKNALRYHIRGRDTRDMKPSVWDAEFRKAFDSWSNVTPLTFEQVDDYSKADIVVDVSRKRRSGFGRSGGILAWAQLPTSPNYDGRLWTVFDLAENWVLPSEEQGIILQAVACHEIGHLLGLGHSWVTGSLMYPYVNGSLRPMEDDIQRIQNLYGAKP